MWGAPSTYWLSFEWLLNLINVLSTVRCYSVARWFWNWVLFWAAHWAIHDGWMDGYGWVGVSYILIWVAHGETSLIIAPTVDDRQCGPLGIVIIIIIVAYGNKTEPIAISSSSRWGVWWLWWWWSQFTGDSIEIIQIYGWLNSSISTDSTGFRQFSASADVLAFSL